MQEVLTKTLLFSISVLVVCLILKQTMPVYSWDAEQPKPPEQDLNPEVVEYLELKLAMEGDLSFEDFSILSEHYNSYLNKSVPDASNEILPTKIQVSYFIIWLPWLLLVLILKTTYIPQVLIVLITIVLGLYFSLFTAVEFTLCLLGVFLGIVLRLKLLSKTV